MWPRPFDSSRRTTLPVPLRMLSSVREAPTFKPAFESTPVVLNNSGYVLSTRVQLRDDERCSDHRGGREKRGANLEMHDCWFSHLGVSSCDDDLALGSTATIWAKWVVTASCLTASDWSEDTNNRRNISAKSSSLSIHWSLSTDDCSAGHPMLWNGKLPNSHY